MKWALINKVEGAHNYGVNERTIQRDIVDLRNFLEADVERTGVHNSVIYDRADKSYRLEQIYQLKLTNAEVLTICNIWLDSRAFLKNMLHKLIACCVPKRNQKLVIDLINNEKFHYMEQRH
jgi:tRNA U38,U39,U40 pseudouridine synthase TruA